MATYTLQSKDVISGCETVISILGHLDRYGIALQSIHYENGEWTVTMDKDIPEKERLHFENESNLTTFARSFR